MDHKINEDSHSNFSIKFYQSKFNLHCHLIRFSFHTFIHFLCDPGAAQFACQLIGFMRERIPVSTFRWPYLYIARKHFYHNAKYLRWQVLHTLAMFSRRLEALLFCFCLSTSALLLFYLYFRLKWIANTRKCA